MDEWGDMLAPMRAAWMAGAPAVKAAPADWAAVSGEGAAAELALAALAGHAWQVAFRPAPVGPLAARAPLPALALPPVAAALHSRLRRLLAAHKGQAGFAPALVQLLAARGVAMHPAVWLPPKRGPALPALYAPWVDWVNDGEARLAKPPKPRAADAALAAELAAMLAVKTTGLLRRTRHLEIPKLKTAPQTVRRHELFGLVALEDLAAALGVAVADLLATAPAGNDSGIVDFAAMVAATGTPADSRALCRAIVEDTACPLAAARPLAPGLVREEAVALLPMVLKRDESPGFELSVELAGPALGLAAMADITAAPGYRALLALLGTQAEGKPAVPHITSGLTAFGLLASPAAAPALLAACLQTGLSPADPKLDMLHLNISLNPEAPA